MIAGELAVFVLFVSLTGLPVTETARKKIQPALSDLRGCYRKCELRLQPISLL